MSCSMMSTEHPEWACTRLSNGPSASVSRWATPPDGSSSSTTAGSWASTHASSTMRRVPVDSSPTSFSRKAPRPMAITSSSTRSVTSASESRLAGRRSPAATRSFDAR